MNAGRRPVACLPRRLRRRQGGLKALAMAILLVLVLELAEV